MGVLSEVVLEDVALKVGEYLRLMIYLMAKTIGSKTLAIRLKELQKGGIPERQAYNEIPPRVEYKLTIKGQELVESLINLLHWMRRWSSNSKSDLT